MCPGSLISLRLHPYRLEERSCSAWIADADSIVVWAARIGAPVADAPLVF